LFYVLRFFRQSLGTTLKYATVDGKPGVIKSNQRITDALRISTASKGGISFQVAKDLPLFERQIIIAELISMNKEMNKH
jgi:hypothetical protein